MANFYFETINNRVRMKQDNGASNTPASSDITTGSVGNSLMVMVKNSPLFNIDTVADNVYINTVVVAKPKTGEQMEALVVALFKDANSGAGSPGNPVSADNVTQGTNQKLLTADEYTKFQLILQTLNVNNPSGT